MAGVKTRDFVSASTAAILDPQLRKALERVGTGFDAARRDAITEVTPQVWEEWREEARRIKNHTLEHLDYYLELVSDKVAAAGGQVHFAKDADEANAIVAQLARERNVRIVTKSKSMVSEELELNGVLESQGVEVFETDLGEYIIQLAGETPSHLVAPALHKTKEQVALLFHEHLGIPVLDDIEAMARAAREVLRDKFLQADLGISGANFVVAETGTLVIITNEGNGRLCTSAPRIHIGITGMEKVIPSLQDLAVFLRLLPRSATGQQITSYVSMITGPRRRDDEDGPEEFHLVLVDNGRSRLLADPQLREALNCIRCGACLNICPVYQKVGGHAYGWVYPGPIGAIVSPVMTGLKQAKDLPQASTLCGACREACPVKIDIPRMLLHLRQAGRKPGHGRKGLHRLGAADGPCLRSADEQSHPAGHRPQDRTQSTETPACYTLHHHHQRREGDPQSAAASFVELDQIQGPATAATSYIPGDLAAGAVLEREGRQIAWPQALERHGRNSCSRYAWPWGARRALPTLAITAWSRRYPSWKRRPRRFTAEWPRIGTRC
ncbi:MAG: iron-sulfur cluster-binding protein [Chloroflexi bacterium]|nr:iron-sulfur cluster-binding protein [Chloroflexota bacterium]